MSEEPDLIASEPVLPPRLSESRGDRILTLGAWLVGLVLITALAGLVAFGMSRLATFSSETEDPAAPLILVEPKPAPVPDPTPAPTTRTPDGGLITHPRWSEPPRPDFPQTAQRGGVESGRVTLDCHVAVDGRIDLCQVLEETPPGAGFAAAAIEAARKARLEPRTVDGRSTEARVRFSTRFELG